MVFDAFVFPGLVIRQHLAIVGQLYYSKPDNLRTSQTACTSHWGESSTSLTGTGKSPTIDKSPNTRVNSDYSTKALRRHHRIPFCLCQKISAHRRLSRRCAHASLRGEMAHSACANSKKGQMWGQFLQTSVNVVWFSPPSPKSLRGVGEEMHSSEFSFQPST